METITSYPRDCFKRSDEIGFTLHHERLAESRDDISNGSGVIVLTDR